MKSPAIASLTQPSCAIAFNRRTGYSPIIHEAMLDAVHHGIMNDYLHISPGYGLPNYTEGLSIMTRFNP